MIDQRDLGASYVKAGWNVSEAAQFVLCITLSTGIVQACATNVNDMYYRFVLLVLLPRMLKNIVAGLSRKFLDNSSLEIVLKSLTFQIFTLTILITY